MPEPDASVAQMWDRWAPSYDHFWRDLNTSEAVKFLDETAPAGGAYLDMGAGTGRLALELAALGNDITCVDISPKMIERLTDKAVGRGLALDTVLADMTDFTTDRRFDCVYFALSAFFSLTSQAQQLRCLTACRRMLGPDGRVVVEAYVPNLEMLAAGNQVSVRSVEQDAVNLSITNVNRAEQILGYTEVRLSTDGTSILSDRQRFCWPTELDALALGAGLVLADRFGGYDRRMYHSGCYMHVSIYQAAE
jgi:ubiquinone/menaquinone biosynthesis C-methylase UbiE